MPAKPRLVFVTADLQKGFGDWVMSLPAVALVRDKWGDAAELVAVVPAYLGELVAWTGLFDRVYPYRPDWCETLAVELDGALLVVALCDSDVIVWEDIARRLAGYRIGTRLLRNRFWKERQHHARMLARNLDLVGVDVPAELRSPVALWRQPGARRCVAVHASCGPLWRPGSKQWPHFASLAYKLQDMGLDVVQIVGPDDTPLPEVATWSGSTRALAVMLLECALFVGNDSGPGHLAGALGVPTHIIFGFTDPELWHPIGPRVTWSRASSTAIGDVSVTQVLAAITGKLAGYQGVDDGIYARAMGD